MFESCWAHHPSLASKSFASYGLASQVFVRNSASLHFSPISSASLTDK